MGGAVIPVIAPEAATKPESAVTNGTARIPAPTVVPATRAADPKTDPGECLNLASTLENSLSPDWPEVLTCRAAPLLIFTYIPSHSVYNKGDQYVLMLRCLGEQHASGDTLSDSVC